MSEIAYELLLADMAVRDRHIEQFQTRIAELESAKLDAVAARVQAENDGAVLRGQIEQLRRENEDLRGLHYQTVKHLLGRLVKLEEIITECLNRTIVSTPEPKGQVPLRQRMWALVQPEETEQQVQP